MLIGSITSGFCEARLPCAHFALVLPNGNCLTSLTGMLINQDKKQITWVVSFGIHFTVPGVWHQLSHPIAIDIVLQA